MATQATVSDPYAEFGGQATPPAPATPQQQAASDPYAAFGGKADDTVAYSSGKPSNPVIPPDTLLDKAGHFVEDVAYPTMGAVAGGAAGAETGPAGVIAGAALGGAAGNEVKRGMRAARGRSDLNPTGWGHAAEAAGSMVNDPELADLPKGVQAALPAIIDDVAKVSPRVARVMNDFVGLQMSDLPKYERVKPGSAAEVGSTIYRESGMKNNLTAQKAAIDSAILRNQAANDTMIQAVDPARKSDVASLIYQSGANLLDELAENGATESQLKAVDPLVEGVLAEHGHDMTPAEMLDMRRAIGNKVMNWNPSTAGIPDRFRQMLYHDLNDTIAGHLEPEQQAAFQGNNRTINRLVIGSQAAGEKLNKGDLKAGFSPMRAAIGALTGGAVGRAFGPAGEAAGAVLGGAAPTVAEHIPAGMLNKLDIQTRNLAQGIYDASVHAVKQGAKTAKPITPQAAVEAARHIVESRTNLQP